jgi:hypothetical protein
MNLRQLGGSSFELRYVPSARQLEGRSYLGTVMNFDRHVSPSDPVISNFFERAAVAVTSALILAPTRASMVAVMADYNVISQLAR